MIALLLVACGPVPRSWVSVDEAEIQALLQAPTAPRPDVATIAEELGDIIAAGGDLESVPATLDPVLAEPGTDNPVPDDGGEAEVVSGTSAFFDVACPGTADAPDPDFASGKMRLEGAFLREDGSLPALGPLYLTFADCALGETVFDGEMRARWVADDERMVALGELALRTDAADLTWDAAFAIDPSGLALSYAIPSGTVTLTIDDDAVQVAFADGEAVCSRQPPATCEAIE